MVAHVQPRPHHAAWNSETPLSLWYVPQLRTPERAHPVELPLIFVSATMKEHPDALWQAMTTSEVVLHSRAPRLCAPLSAGTTYEG